MPSADLPKPGNRKRSLHILCADDDSMIGELMLHLFSEAGHAVEYVGDGLSAWDRLAEDPGHFDVLITDNQMPGLSGLGLVERLRQTEYPGRIVVQSGGLSGKEAASYRSFGVDLIVPKMLPAEKLVQAIESLDWGTPANSARSWNRPESVV